MNKQLLRLKQRSNGDVLQVSECDDTNNLYVNVANVHGYLIEGLWNGGDCKITLENATALTGLSGFPAEVYIKRL